MKRVVILFALFVLGALIGQAAEPKKPNVIIIFMDDMGYADVGCYGAKGYTTPHMDQMAKDGLRLTDFYVGSSVCTPSRASLLTGCYPGRVGLPRVLFPRSRTGLNPSETTIPETLKDAGYKTCMVGKWHLGDNKRFLPLQHGFDEYFGLPYSNDMLKGKRGMPPLPLIDGNTTIEEEPDQRLLTKRYTERAVKFIAESKDKPFFLYLAHTMPHVPIFASDAFKGKTKRGLYGDVITELDWSVGQVLKALKDNGLDEKTVVVMTSDNGPWLQKKDHAGSALPLRGGKFSIFEGGMRIPCIVRWPGTIKPRESSDIAATIDLLPTIAAICGAKLPKQTIDGVDLSGFLLKGEASPRTTFFYKTNAVRQGKWKLILGGKGKKSKGAPVSLYDLKADVGESTNVANDHPDIVKRLTALLEAHRTDLRKDSRPAGQLKKQ